MSERECMEMWRAALRYQALACGVEVPMLANGGHAAAMLYWQSAMIQQNTMFVRVKTPV